MSTNMLFIGILFAAVLAFSEAELQCEGSDVSKWWLPWGEKHNDQVETPTSSALKYQVCQPFNAFGHSYNVDGFRISIRGGAGAGSVWVYPKGGIRMPGSYEIRASRGAYKESTLGVVSSRVSELPSDIDRAARIINEGYPCMSRGTFIPNVVFVATFTCMKYNSGRDTFQVIVAVNGVRTYLIMNYHMLHTVKSGLQFALIDRSTKNKYNLIDNMPRRELTQELLESTNGIRTGTWVYDLTETDPKRPDPCPKTDNDCTMTNFGSIQSYDYAFNRIPADVRRTFSRSELAPHHECNFIAHVTMDTHGNVKYVDLNAGYYTDDDTDTMFNFEVNRDEGKVKMRGPGLRKAEVLNLGSGHYDWKINTTTIVKIIKKDDGWVLNSGFCGYRLEYRPLVEPVVKMTVGEDYEGELEGLCHNDDGDFYNDA